MVRATSYRSRQTVWTAFGCLCILLIAFLAAEGVRAAETTDGIPRVLILYPYDERIPGTSIAGEAARTRLLETTSGKIDLFSEFLDLSRFPEKVHVERMAHFLAEKYAERRPSVVIAIGQDALGFIVANRQAIAPDAKIVFCCFSGAEATTMNLPSDVVGARTEFDITKTLEMARRLQPDARKLVVMGGSSDFDRSWIATAREDLGELAKNYETTYMTDLSIDEFVERASQLSADTILLVLTVFADRTGRNFIPRDALEKIAGAASAPTYGPYSTYVGFGVVGGNTVTFEAAGATVADLAVDTLAGKPIADVDVPQTYVADARQLIRWGLSESRLPPGTVQSFREKSLWEEHWVAVVATLAVIALQCLLIAGLLVERRQRRAAEQQSRVRLLELVHLNQSATAGALSASIAHELNQPLGAIRSNAEAAEIILQGKAPDLGLVRQILGDIRDDDQRAGDIIVRLRGLLKKRSEIDWQEFDFNEVISSTLQILHTEAEQRGVAVRSSQPVCQLSVRADRVHIQQVILNLAINAMDAMVDAAPTERKLEFQASLTKDSKVELSISDTGRGIPTAQLASVFEPFYTTKLKGTGLGLSISRTIIETYGGRIWATNLPGGGAVFRFNLPLAHHG